MKLRELKIAPKDLGKPPITITALLPQLKKVDKRWVPIKSDQLKTTKCAINALNTHLYRWKKKLENIIDQYELLFSIE